MKCSRCGEECKVGQTFCLKCGTPIQIEPDINEFESEIADNVGKLLKDDKSDKTLEIWLGKISLSDAILVGTLTSSPIVFKTRRRYDELLT